MKKLSLFLITAVMALSLSGCCLRHDMLPATCTEPSTCSKCGKTVGEPLGHTEIADAAVEPTCTEPGLTEGSHCEVCGEVLTEQTSIDPLGHTEVADAAVEPTCTEPGLTAGSHCEVCGEVLTEQTSIDPLGHVWEEATFSLPKTCQVCGATEGEPLESAFFVNALNPPLPEEGLEEVKERLLETVADEESETDEDAELAGDSEMAAVSIHKDVKISGHAHGLGEADEFINDSSLSVITDIEDEKALFCAEAVVKGSKPVKALIDADKEGIGLALPGIMEERYRISYDLLQELANGAASGYGSAAGGKEAADGIYEQIEELFNSKEVRDLLLKYERILFSVVSLKNSTESRMEYELPALGQTQNCWVITCQPDAGDWKAMLQKLFTEAAGDTDLKEKLLVPLAKLQYASGTSYSGYYDSPEDLADEMANSLREAASSALEEVDSAAEFLADWTLTAAYDSGRLYALRVLNQDKQGVSYESFGAPETEREDVLVLHSDDGDTQLVRNSIQVQEQSASGRLTVGIVDAVLDYVFGTDENDAPYFDLQFSLFDMNARFSLENEDEEMICKAAYDASDAGAELEAVISETDERLSMPDGPVILLTSKEEAEKAAENISESLRQAELFGHVWKEASCTEPRTCEICGETEGDPLGHDWSDWDENGTRTCQNCGETEKLFEEGELPFEDDGAGYPRLQLSEEQKEEIEEISQIIIRYTDEGILRQGRLSSLESLYDEDGALPGILTGDWFNVNGYTAVFLQESEEITESGSMQRRGYIPFFCGDEIGFLLVTEQDGAVAVEDVLGSDGEPDKTRKDTDRIRLAGEIYDDSLNFQDIKPISPAFPLGQAMDISLQPWSDEDELTSWYILADGYGNTYATENLQV